MAANFGNGERLKLAFRRPLHPGNLFGHLAATAIPGVEEVRGRTYRRTLRLPFGAGIAELTPEVDHIACRLRLADPRDRGTDPLAIDGQLAKDPRLKPLIARAPGRRVPRTVDGSEMAVRAVIGQQISTAAARTHAGRLVKRHGEPVSDPDGGLSHLFPPPEALSDVELAMPAGRRATVHALLTALGSGELDLSPDGDRERARAALEAIPGIGPWTIEVVAMRALGDPDAFPATDLGVRRGAEQLGLPAGRADLIARAERWRPWRAYAVQHLWGATAHPINDWPPPA